MVLVLTEALVVLSFAQLNMHAQLMNCDAVPIIYILVVLIFVIFTVTIIITAYRKHMLHMEKSITPSILLPAKQI